jgi:hypothetical protein
VFDAAKKVYFEHNVGQWVAEAFCQFVYEKANGE